MTKEIMTSAEIMENAVLPDARVVRADGNEDACAENAALPVPAAGGQPQLPKSPAESAWQRLGLYIEKFEELLDEEHEVGMGYAGSDAGTLRIVGVGYFAPDIITFYGEDPRGAKTQLVQHVSQLNVLLRAMPKAQEKPNRIGFRVRRSIEEGGDTAENGAEGGTEHMTEEDPVKHATGPGSGTA